MKLIVLLAVADLEEGRGGARRGEEGRGGARRASPPPLFWVRKEDMTEGKLAGRASKSSKSIKSPPPPSP